MKRPSLQRLLNDIENGKIDMIVVYKIDRLSRSLYDFSHLITFLEKHNCSFVSITQNFNTKDASGKLMLNILLSFAQFEREISAERIRDKIAASKAKGMWMGGRVPFGYGSVDKKLIIKEDEANIIKFIFNTYKTYKSDVVVCKLLSENNISARNGTEYFTKSCISKILQNPVYAGKILHKKMIHDGQHKAIIDPIFFDNIQEIRKNKMPELRVHHFSDGDTGILREILYCGCCYTRMGVSPSICNGIKRHYYVSTQAKKKGYHTCRVKMIPTGVLDEFIMNVLKPILKDGNILQDIANKITPLKTGVKLNDIVETAQDMDKVLKKIPVRQQHLIAKLLINQIFVDKEKIEIYFTALCKKFLPRYLKDKLTTTLRFPELECIIFDMPFYRKRGSLKISLPEEFEVPKETDPKLINALARGFKWHKMLEEQGVTITELSKREKIDRGFLGRHIRLRYLAPDIVEAILNGKQPKTLTLFELMRTDIPALWEEQRKKFGFKKVNTTPIS